MRKGAIVVFARRPNLGEVKTRLASFFGDDCTLALYRAFLNDTLLAARKAEATVLLAHTPGSHFPELEHTDIAFEQHGRAFGERFDTALAEAVNHLPNGTPLILIGADTPHLSPDSLRGALNLLEGSEAVLGSCINGGFYLLGFSSRPVEVSRVFSYSSERQPVELCRAIVRAGLKPELLEPSFDVDTPLDLFNLKMLLDLREAAGSEWVPPQTQRMLHHDQRIATSMRVLGSERLKTPVSFVPT